MVGRKLKMDKKATMKLKDKKEVGKEKTMDIKESNVKSIRKKKRSRMSIEMKRRKSMIKK